MEYLSDLFIKPVTSVIQIRKPKNRIQLVKLPVQNELNRLRKRNCVEMIMIRWLRRAFYKEVTGNVMIRRICQQE